MRMDDLEPLSATRQVAAKKVSRSEFRAFWVDAFHAGIKSRAEVDQLIRDVRSARANAVLVQVRRRGDAYYNCSIEPRAPELRKQPDYDPLAYLIEVAHAARPAIEVHAWLAALPIATASAPPTAPEHVYASHGPAAAGDAMWLSMALDGTFAAEDTLSLDPGHPAAAQHIVDVALDLAHNYAVDGLHFDRIRYAGQQFGYNPVSVARFNAATGASGVPEPTDPAWQAWRRDQVTALMRQIYLEAVALKPKLKISAATITWGNGPANDAGWRNGSAMTGVFQDWPGWLREGILDLAIPMNYDREADARQKVWFDNWIEWEKKHRAGRHLVIGLGAFLNATADTLAQARRALAASARGARAQGVAFYSYAGTDKDGLPAADLFRALTRVGQDGTRPLFTARVKPPLMAWKARPTNGYLKGFVRHPDGRPGDGLTVEISGPVWRVLTVAGTGFYGAAGLAPGHYGITVTCFGQPLAAAEAVVRAGKVATVNLEL
jgi:uncharacterized lipoprotein YddW (UPF0748 family)